MKRRTFLTALAALPAVIAVPELLVPKRTFFLPPPGGWKPRDYALDSWPKTFTNDYDIPSTWEFRACEFVSLYGQPISITITDRTGASRTFFGPEGAKRFFIPRCVLMMDSPADALAKAAIVMPKLTSS